MNNASEKSYDNTNRGALWRNDRKTKEKSPDFTGNLNVDGKWYRVAGWDREEGAASNAPIIRLNVEPKEETEQTKAEPEKPLPADWDEDKIPF